MIFGKTIDGEQWLPLSGKDEAVGVVLLHGEVGDMKLEPLQFSPQEARDLAKGLVWAAETAESDQARIDYQTLQDRV